MRKRFDFEKLADSIPGSWSSANYIANRQRKGTKETLGDLRILKKMDLVDYKLERGTRGEKLGFWKRK